MGLNFLFRFRMGLENENRIFDCHFLRMRLEVSFDRVRVHFYIISLNTLILAMAEEDYLILFTGEGERRVERRL